MALIKNAINFGNGFNIGAVGPIDARMRVQYLNDLTSAWTDSIPSYPGMIVTVMYDQTKPIKDTEGKITGYEPLGHVYVLKGSDATNINNWVKLSTAADSAVSADAVQENLEKEIEAREKADEVLSGAIQSNYNLITANTTTINTVSGNVETLKTNFEVEVLERQQADIFLSGVTSGLVETLKEYKIKDIKSDDKILAVDIDGKLSSTLGIKYDSSSKTITLVGINGAQIGDAIDATDFIKDGMLQNVELKTVGSETKLVFTFNTDSGKEEIPVDVTSLLNGTELHNLEASLSAHTASTTVHFTGEEKGAFLDLIGTYNKTALDTKFSENIQAHTDLSAEIASANTHIASANTRIDGVDTKVDELASANTEVHEALNAGIIANTTAIGNLGAKVDVLLSANTEAHDAFNDAIIDNTTAIGNLNTKVDELASANTEAHEALSGAIDTLRSKVSENEEVVAEALVDLKNSKVSAISSEEGSNIVINEVKDENGISYTIGFQWLTF